VRVLPDDVLVCKVQDRENKLEYQFMEHIGKEMIVDTIVTFDIDGPILGLVNGIGAIFGTESKSNNGE